MDPHVYSVVENCFQRLFEKGATNQAMVITGESGAGKSFTTNRMLDYLACIGRPADEERPPAFRNPPIKVSDLSFEEKSITDKLLTSTAIVEAFGNAKMPRNNDSSRFGKLYKIYFDPKDRFIKGCSIDPYLLEKSRVTSLANGERNFHIFYELVRGLTEEEKTKHRVKALEDYAWLHAPPGVDSTYDVERKDDGEELIGVKDALNNFCEGNVDNIIASTLGVLRMGDIVIEARSSEEASIPGYDDAIGDVAHLFQVEEEVLKNAIIGQTILIMGNDKFVPISPVAATKFNAAIAKAVYIQQFEWMIARCSESLVADVPRGGDETISIPFIAVLDIFGFEFVNDTKLLVKGSSDKNSFEQWCINACNEKLQTVFVEIVIDLEKVLYKAELGEVPEMHFQRNDDTLDLIFGRKKSVYAVLENVCLTASRSSDADANFDLRVLDDIKHNLGKNERLDIKAKSLKQYMKAKKSSPGGFILKHYAANVLYDPDGWVEKNQDKITVDMKKCLANSTMDGGSGPGSGWLPEVYKAVMESKGYANDGSILAQFRRDLNSLCDTLCRCDTGFVRCIKPNKIKVPNVFESDLVLTQLAYTGMLSTLRIQKAGYPIRKKFDDYLNEMRVLDPDAAKEGIQALVDSINKNRLPGIIEALPEKPPQDQLDSDAVRVGKVALVLSRDWAQTQIEIQCKQVKGASAVTIQAAYRANESTKLYQTKNKATFDLMPLIRGTLARLEYYPRKAAKLEIMSRSSLTCALRATRAKSDYYKERILLFRDENIKTGQSLIQATLYRQWYYERKIQYMQHENLVRERSAFSRLDDASAQYIDDWAEELGAEIVENETMSREEEYVVEVSIAKGAEEFKRESEGILLEAEESRRKALIAIRKVQALQATDRRHETAMQENHVRIARVATQKSKEVLMRMGVIRTSGGTQVAPPLKPLPAIQDQAGLEKYFQSYYARHRGRPVTTGVDLDSNVDVSHLHGEAKQNFVRNVARTMGVEDGQVKLVLGLPDTPAPTPRPGGGWPSTV